ncbi:hypothetical protein O181_118271 [Austropuccinia psidii MF-1]|uniref:Integrase zinc-binding domain-containing protein n=1 Tax=Austropuccinia psidii MF-1 TaxID=1389203 RepID=A0A9Q3PYP0_9BASI|nr:hypothetical protein [Austropuccinia psidii MF-1]
MTIIYKEGKIHTNSDCLSRWPLDNIKNNTAYDSEVAAKIPIHFKEIDRKKNFRFSELELGSGTPDTNQRGPDETKTPILGISSSELKINIVIQILNLEEPWLKDYRDNKFFLIDGLLYHRKKHTIALVVIHRDHTSLILQECHDCPYMGHMSEDRTKEMVTSTAWWPQWEKQLRKHINICERFQKANRKHGKKYGIL